MAKCLRDRDSLGIVYYAYSRYSMITTAGTRLFFSGVRIGLGLIFNYLILWVRVKGQG